jgi:hypothetical protein
MPSASAQIRPQSDRFIETARATECDEDEAAFKAKLRVIARQKLKDEPKPKKGGEDAG